MDYKKMTETRQSCRAFPRRGLTRVACRLESCYNDISGQGNHGARDDGANLRQTVQQVMHLLHAKDVD